MLDVLAQVLALQEPLDLGREEQANQHVLDEGDRQLPLQVGEVVEQAPVRLALS
jgi:hypothetical protein